MSSSQWNKSRRISETMETFIYRARVFVSATYDKTCRLNSLKECPSQPLQICKLLTSYGPCAQCKSTFALTTPQEMWKMWTSQLATSVNTPTQSR